MSTLEVKAIQAPSGFDLQMPAGHILQVVSVSSATEEVTTSTSFVALSGLTASITPSFASSKIFAIFDVPVYQDNNGEQIAIQLFRGTTSGTALGNGTWGFGAMYTGGALMGHKAGNYLDSPNTTSSQTYTVAHRVTGGTGKSMINNGRGTITLMEIAG